MQLFDSNGTSIARVENIQQAVRVSTRPMDTLAWNTIAGKSGVIATPAAGATLFSFRNSGVNNVLVRRLGIGAVVAAAITTSQVVDFQALVARAFTVADSGGTLINLTANAGKHRTSLASLTFGGTAGAALIPTTAALTIGTRTLDTSPIGQVAGTSGTVLGTTIIAPSKSNLVQHDITDYPILLAPSEGLVIANITALASGSLYVYVDMEVTEVLTTNF